MALPRAILCATALLALAACNETAKPKTAGDAGARVNGAAVPQRPTTYALERAIDQEVIVQRAMADGLDRRPEVAARLEAARRAVITQAWFDLVAASRGESQAEVQKLRMAARIEYLNPPSIASLF